VFALITRNEVGQGSLFVLATARHGTGAEMRRKSREGSKRGPGQARAAVGRVALKKKREEPVMWGITDGRDKVGTIDRVGKTYIAKDADGIKIGAFAKWGNAVHAVNRRYDQQHKKWKRAA
jgi:hypothetical protein